MTNTPTPTINQLRSSITLLAIIENDDAIYDPSDELTVAEFDLIQVFLGWIRTGGYSGFEAKKFKTKNEHGEFMSAIDVITSDRRRYKIET